MLVIPPQPHPDMSACGLKEQQKLFRAWMLVAAYLMLDARPSMYPPPPRCFIHLNNCLDLSTDMLSNTFGSLLNDMSCEACIEGLKRRVNDIVVEWSLLRVSEILGVDHRQED